MKKTICLLLLVQSGLMMAQQNTKTFVTPFGEKIKMSLNTVDLADNGLTAVTGTVTPQVNGKIELGGNLIKATKIETDPINLLEISGAKTGAIKITDGNQAGGNVLISDVAGVGKWGTSVGVQNALFQRFPFDVKSTNYTYTVPVGNVPKNIPLTNPPGDVSSKYKAQVSGKYMVNFHGYFVNLGPNPVMRQYYFAIKNLTTNGITMMESTEFTGDVLNSNITQVIQLTVGDEIDFSICTQDPGLVINQTNVEVRNYVEVFYMGL